MTEKKHIIRVSGMTCTNCANSVKRIITNEGGIDVHVSFTTGEASFNLNSSLDKLKGSISRSGFGVIENEIEEKYSKIEKLFLFSLLFTAPLFLHMFASSNPILNNKWFQMGLTIPVLLTGGLHFIKSGIQ